MIEIEVGKDTRNESFFELEESGKLGNRQARVLEVIREHSFTYASNRWIARVLGWPINCVTGRVNELRKLGKVESAGRVYDSETGRMVHAWKVKE